MNGIFNNILKWISENIVSVVALIVSIVVALNNHKTTKLKQSPLLFLAGSFENKVDNYIDFNVTNLSEVILNEFEVTWVGSENIEVRTSETLNKDKNNFNYQIIFDMSKIDKTYDVKGVINIYAKTKYKHKFKYQIDINILSKYNEFCNEYVLELDTKCVSKRLMVNN